MLVLSRKRQEKIVIGEGDSKIIITVVDVRHEQVRIGIDAPKSIKVHREEVANAIAEEKPNRG